MDTPTPETDDAARKGAYLVAGEYPETCGKQIVHIDFARKLERERNGALARIEELEGNSIHSCHDQCKRPACIKRREKDARIAALRWALSRIHLGDFFDVSMREIAGEALALDTPKP